MAIPPNNNDLNRVLIVDKYFLEQFNHLRPPSKRDNFKTVGYIGDQLFGYILDDDSPAIQDIRSVPTGLEYAADYSGTFTSRSLVDKGYVDTAIAGIPGYAVTNEADNRIITSTGVNTGNAEVNLTFDGSTLTVVGTVNATAYSGGNVANWDTAFGWGDHAGLYALSSHTHLIGQITDFTDNSSNWNTAFGWGNHASAGYVSFPYTIDDASTSTSIEIAAFNRTTSGTAADGIGGYISIGVEDDLGVIRSLRIGHSLMDATSASVDSQLVIYGREQGAELEFLRIESSGAGAGADGRIFIGSGAGQTSGSHATDNTISIGSAANGGSLNVGAEGIAIGSTAQSSGSNSIALGSTALSSGSSSISIGIGAEAEATNAIAIGNNAGDTTGTKGIDSISIGTGANDGAGNIGNGSVAIGKDAISYGSDGVAISEAASASASNSIAIGVLSLASFNSAIAIGAFAEAETQYSISIGYNAGDATGTKGNEYISIGYNANAGAINIGTQSVTIGYSASAQSDQAIAIGFTATAKANAITVIGDNAGNTSGTHGVSAVVIGDSAGAGTLNIGTDAILIGDSAKADTSGSIAIGLDAGAVTGQTNGTNWIAIGEGAGHAGGGGTIDIGTEAVVVGYYSAADGLGAVMIGSNAGVYADYGIAIGHTSGANGVGSIGIGRNCSGGVDGAIMMGYTTGDLTNDRTNSFALGWSENIPSMWIEKYTATTTGVAGTATVDIPIDSSSTYNIEIQIVGGETDATPTMYYSNLYHAGVYRIGTGNATFMGGVTAGGIEQQRSAAASTENVTASISVSTTNLRITFNGPDTTSTAMNWRALVRMTKVISN